MDFHPMGPHIFSEDHIPLKSMGHPLWGCGRSGSILAALGSVVEWARGCGSGFGGVTESCWRHEMLDYTGLSQSRLLKSQQVPCLDPHQVTIIRGG